MVKVAVLGLRCSIRIKGAVLGLKVPIYLEAVADLTAEGGLHVGDDRGGGDAQAPRRLHQFLCQSARLKHGWEVKGGAENAALLSQPTDDL